MPHRQLRAWSKGSRDRERLPPIASWFIRAASWHRTMFSDRDRIHKHSVCWTALLLRIRLLGFPQQNAESVSAPAPIMPSGAQRTLLVLRLIPNCCFSLPGRQRAHIRDQAPAVLRIHAISLGRHLILAVADGAIELRVGLVL